MKFQMACNEIHEGFNEYKLSESLMGIYKLIWDDFCSGYLEMVKPAFGSPVSAATLNDVKLHFDNILRLLHPFMPFISEELHHAIFEGQTEKPMILSDYPKAGISYVTINDQALQIVSELRNMRNAKGLSPKHAFSVIIQTEHVEAYKVWEYIIAKLANVSDFNYNAQKPEKYLSALIGTDELFVPYAEQLDEAEEKKKIEEEISYLQGFLKSVDAKLNNEKFVANAKPEVIEKERQKKADAEEKIKKLMSGN
jgi:valyl-tRNA synthetase